MSAPQLRKRAAALCSATGDLLKLAVRQADGTYAWKRSPTRAEVQAALQSKIAMEAAIEQAGGDA